MKIYRGRALRFLFSNSRDLLISSKSLRSLDVDILLILDILLNILNRSFYRLNSGFHRSLYILNSGFHRSLYILNPSFHWSLDILNGSISCGVPQRFIVHTGSSDNISDFSLHGILYDHFLTIS